MNFAFRHVALVLGLLFGLVTVSFAEDYDPNVQALDSFRLTLKKHPTVPFGKPNMDGVRAYAENLMLIKNALSLYRDGAMNQQDEKVLKNLIGAELDYTNAALAAADGWPMSQKKLLRTMHYHALAANQLAVMRKDNPNFKGLMAAYHSGIGHDAYREAQDAGIEQNWEEAP